MHACAGPPAQRERQSNAAPAPKPPRAKSCSATEFSTRWQRIEDIGVGDLRQVLFAFNEEECEHELIKNYEKDDLMQIFEYAVGLDKTEALSHRNRRGLILCDHCNMLVKFNQIILIFNMQFKQIHLTFEGNHDFQDPCA